MRMIVSGTTIADKVLVGLAAKIKKLKIKPTLVNLVAGGDVEGCLYSRLKEKKAREIGIVYKKITFDLKTDSPKKLVGIIRLECKNANGILVQKPGSQTVRKYFKKIQDFKLFWHSLVMAIDPAKDIDCLTPQNLGLLVQGIPLYLPATVAAVVRIMSFAGNLAGKNIAVLGSSEILGKPLALYLRDQGATIFLCGSKTRDIASLCKNCEIIISCVGQPGLVNKNFVTQNSIVIDAGIKKVGNRILGDADFEAIKGRVKALTPVPGGVGPLTIACLLENTVNAASLK